MYLAKEENQEQIDYAFVQDKNSHFHCTDALPKNQETVIKDLL